MIEASGIDPLKKVHSVTREERRALVAQFKCFRIHPTGFRPIDEAIITSGGVSVKELSPKTMESKKQPGLYFAGEILDVDGECGGFNLQWAYSSARTVAAALDRE